MEYLGFMNGKEAIRLAKEVSGLTESQIAAGLGVSVSVVKRYLKKDDAYFPSLEMIPRLCAVLGNTILLDWQMRQLEREKNSCEDVLGVVPLAATTIMEAVEPLAEMSPNVRRSRYEDIAEALDEVLLQCTRIWTALPLETVSKKKKNGIFSCPLWNFRNKH